MSYRYSLSGDYGIMLDTRVHRKIHVILSFRSLVEKDGPVEEYNEVL